MRRKLPVLVLLLLVAAVFFALDVDRYMTLDGLRAGHTELLALYERQPALVVIAFMLVQISALALCLPGSVLSLSLAAGAIFGPAWGALIVLVSITLGDSLGFLLARYLLRDWVERRFPEQLAAVDRGVERDGAFYLLGLRLMAAIPFFVVNVTMALTRMRLRVFAPVSFIGLAPATALYVNAGTALAAIRSPGDVMSLRLGALLVALGLLPIAARLAFRSRPAS